MMHFPKLAIILASVVLSGCLHDDVVRTRWADGSTLLRQDVTPTLSISSVAAEATAATRWRDLPERSGAAFAEALAQRIPDARQYVATLAEPIAPRSVLNRNRTVLSRVIAVDVSPSGYDPVNRLARTQITIVPTNFQFAGYTFAQTEYQTIDLETITNSQTQSASLTLSPQFGNAIEALEAGVSTEQTRDSSYTNRARLRDLSVNYSPRRIVLTRDAGPGMNLWGITILKASVRPIEDDATLAETLVTGFKIANEATGADLSPAEATVTLSLDTVWKPTPLYVCAQLQHVSRHVSVGMEYYDEGQQQIRESESKGIPTIYEFVSNQEIETPRFALETPSGGVIHISAPTGNRPLNFTSALDATTMMTWLARTSARQIGTRNLMALDSVTGNLVPLQSQDNGQLQVRRLRASAPTANLTEGAMCDIKTGQPTGR